MVLQTQKIIHNYDFSPTRLLVQFGLLYIIFIVNTFSVEASSFYEKNGKKCFYCPAGFYWIDDCLVSDTHAVCRQCPNGTYQESQNIAHYCGRCDRCDELIRNYKFAAELERCTSVSNTVCGCTGSYHFVPEYGGNGKGQCKENSKCSTGYGLVRNATHFKDTECEKCVSGSTYSVTSSFESCVPCRDSCPNNTSILQSCNSTHDLQCETGKDLDRPDSKFTNRDTGDSSMYIVIFVASALSTFGIFMCIFFFARRRLNSKPNTEKIVWIEECIKDNNVLWDKLFSTSMNYILPDWEAFVRKLMSMSKYSGNIDGVIQVAKEAHEKEKVQSRIHLALSSWKEKCYDEEQEMLKIFYKAVKEHNKSKLSCIKIDVI